MPAMIEVDASTKEIANQLGRCPSTILRELSRPFIHMIRQHFRALPPLQLRRIRVRKPAALPMCTCRNTENKPPAHTGMPRRDRYNRE
ncbi:MAG: helix-turn-helix domain-containing protein [Acidimicrobiia bacterium]|nr:helix-turn-helix domain-containing protein [Acidimicrobiia bacterium]